VTRSKRYTTQEVDELLRRAFASGLGAICAVLRQHHLAGSDLERDQVEALCRALEVHSGALLGTAAPAEEGLASILPSPSLADGMARILCPKREDDEARGLFGEPR
jgi:hypothetical protein